MGIRRKTLDWFRSYLSDRRQVVKLRDFISNELNNKLGVPQRSILGLLLFILYINDIPRCLKHCLAKLFVDDTLIYIVSDTIEDATSKINHDLETISKRLCQNKLKSNVNKTKAIVITNKNIDRNNINLYINQTKLEIEHKIRYLGVIIDDKLCFDKNINHVCRKVGQKVNVLNRLRNELNIEQKLTLLKSIIEPHFNYCASILFLSNTTDLHRLQIIQNKCLRQILRTLKFVYKIIKGQAPQYLTERIKYKNENQTRILRNSNEICFPNFT